MTKIEARVESRLESQPDPLAVRRTTAMVVKNLQFVTIREEALRPFAQRLQDQIKMKDLLTQSQLGARQVNPQRVFLQDVVNFCFWAAKGEEKWAVEYPPGKVTDGWAALVACFDRALEENIPILDASYLERLTLKEANQIFRSSSHATIPLLEARVENLREAGQVLNRRFGGSFENLLKEARHDTPRLLGLIVDNFSSFADSTAFGGDNVHFFKRAQICVYDTSLLPAVPVTGLEGLTIFADYKLPQVFRHFGILEYHPSLANKVDAMEPLEKGSLEEIEIRSASIWVGELLAAEIGVIPAVVDNATWSLGTTLNGESKPYHRVLTTAY